MGTRAGGFFAISHDLSSDEWALGTDVRLDNTMHQTTQVKVLPGRGVGILQNVWCDTPEEYADERIEDRALHYPPGSIPSVDLGWSERLRRGNAIQDTLALANRAGRTALTGQLISLGVQGLREITFNRPPLLAQQIGNAGLDALIIPDELRSSH